MPFRLTPPLRTASLPPTIIIERLLGVAFAKWAPIALALWVCSTSLLGCLHETTIEPGSQAPQSHPQYLGSLPIPLRLAVLEFDNPTLDPTIEKLRVLLPDLLISNLAGRGQITVVERALLNKIISEQSLQVSGAVTDDQVVRIGALSGASGLLVGKVFSVDRMTARIEARLIGVQNGEVLGTFAASGGKQNVIGLATNLSLHILSRAGVALDASEQLYLNLFARNSVVSPGGEGRHIPPSQEPYLVSEHDNLFWKQFATPGMRRADELDGIALVTTAETIWPNDRDGLDDWPPPEIVQAHFEEAFTAQARAAGLSGVMYVRTLDGITSQPRRLLLVPTVRSVHGGWDCSWHHFMRCRVWNPRYFAEVRARLIALNYARHTYWESAQTVGRGSASTPDGAVRDAYESLIWKWMDSLVSSKQLAEFRSITREGVK